jgi:hypothetical protein
MGWYNFITCVIWSRCQFLQWYTLGECWVNEYGTLVDWHWQGTSQYWGDISHSATVSSTNLNWTDEARTRASAVTVRPLSAWVIERQLVLLKWLNERENEEWFQVAQDKTRWRLIAGIAMNLKLSEKSGSSPKWRMRVTVVGAERGALTAQ